MSRIVVLAEKFLNPHDGKTAAGLLRYRAREVVCIIDSTRAGTDVASALGADVGRGIPVLRSIGESLRLSPDVAMVGICPSNGLLYPSWRTQILEAIRAGMHVISGLHFFLGDDPELSEAARRHDVALQDVRKPREEPRVAAALPHREGSRTILTVGADTASGKMTTALELDAAARRHGLSSSFLATGQTGIMISGEGVPADAVVSDFLAGAVEELTMARTQENDYVFVEGQGALNHPAYSAVTLGIMHGARPDALVLCVEPGRRHLKTVPACRVPEVSELIQINEQAARWCGNTTPPRVAGISLNTTGLPLAEAQDAVQEIQEYTGIPTTDPVRLGVERLLHAVA